MTRSGTSETKGNQEPEPCAGPELHPSRSAFSTIRGHACFPQVLRDWFSAGRVGKGTSSPSPQKQKC